MGKIDKKSGSEIRNPSFFQSPPFWRTDWDEVNEFLDGLKKGIISEIGKSYGGRSIRAVSYGEKEPIDRRCSLSTAKFSGFSEHFFDPAKRTRPVVLIISTIHGAEVEGCASCINLAHLLETGKDLLGKKREELLSLAQQARVVMVPIAQPDGRVRSGVRNLIGGSLEDVYYYGHYREPHLKQGEIPTGNLLFENRHFKDIPLTPDKVERLGGYYNDAGVNIDLDNFLSGNVMPESEALLGLVLEETPEMHIVLHGHGPGPWIASPNLLIPPFYQSRQIEIGALVAERHRREGLRPKWHPRTVQAGEGYFATVNLPVALHYVSDSLPLAFEFPHGLAKHPYTLEEIIEVGMTLFEEILRFAVQWRWHCRRYK